MVGKLLDFFKNPGQTAQRQSIGYLSHKRFYHQHGGEGWGMDTRDSVG